MFTFKKMTSILTTLILLSASVTSPALAQQNNPLDSQSIENTAIPEDNSSADLVNSHSTISGRFGLTITSPEGSLAMEFSKEQGAPTQFEWDITWQDEGVKGACPQADSASDSALAGDSSSFAALPTITPNRGQTAAPSSHFYVIDFPSDIPGSTASIQFEDAYFLRDAADENLPLAYTSMALSATVYTKGQTAKALEMLGFQDVWTIDYDKSATPWDNNFVGLTIARKTVIEDGKKMQVFALVCRGTQGLEWLSNFNLGREEEQTNHQGFSLAAERAQWALETYYGACLDAGVIVDDITSTAVWVMGHSRGGAVANLLAASLNQTKTIANKDRIFAFTFAAPNVSRGQQEHWLGYENIRNYINPKDIITLVPLSRGGWGYWRYGTNIFMSYAVEKQVAQRFERYSALPYKPFNYLTLEIIISSLQKLIPTWQDYYGVQDTYDVIEEKSYSVSDVFELLAFILANISPDSRAGAMLGWPEDFALPSDDPIGALLEIIFPQGKPPPELEHGHTFHTYLLFLEILSEQAIKTDSTVSGRV